MNLMLPFKLTLLLLLNLIYVDIVIGLTCQGGSYNVALKACPDGGAQKLSSGGNLTITLKHAFGLKNLDFSGPSAGVSDPFVRFTYGKGQIKESRVIRNELNPVWNEAVTLGVLASATEILIEMWDFDIGTEGANDLMHSRLIRVPFCSTFAMNKVVTVDCGEPFGCFSEDSSWAMPARKMCNETQWVNLDPAMETFEVGKCKLGIGSCLLLNFITIPFQLEVDYIIPGKTVLPPKLTALGRLTEAAPWTMQYDVNKSPNGVFFGQLYQGSPIVVDLIGSTDSKYIEGSLMYIMSKDDKKIGPSGAVAWYLSVNFPAVVYVCRDKVDNDKAIPEWLYSWNALNKTGIRIKVEGASNPEVYYECFYMLSEGTKKNKYKGVESGAIPIHVNTVDDKYGTTAADVYYNNMFVVLALPLVVLNNGYEIIITYQAGGFISSIFQYGFIWAWFAFLVMRLLVEVNFRLDRFSHYLTTRSFVGEDKNMVASLFLCNGESPSNIHYRAHIYHAQSVLYFWCLVPFILLLSWGYNLSYLYQPYGLGLCVAWLGMAALLFWFGFNLWKSCNWRMNPTTLVAFIISVVFCLIFILTVIFSDPAVQFYGESVNFSSLSLLFGTINTMPLLFYLFKQDKTYKIDLQKLMERMTQAVYDIAEQKGKPITKKKKILNANMSLHSLLGDAYTINPNVPLLKLTAVIQDSIHKNDKQVFSYGDPIYNTSIFILFLYLMLAISQTEQPSLAFLNCLTLILLDTLHSALAAGDTNWTPGYKICLLVIGRLLIMTSDGGTWLLNYSLCYMVYALAYIDEIVNLCLPMLTKQQAGDIAFSGNDLNANLSTDFAGTPYFTLSLLTFAFIAIVLVSIWGDKSALPVSNVNVFGMPWSVTIFGIIAVLVVITSGFIMSTVRAFYLKKSNLLRGYARNGYFIRREIDIPLVLALLAEISIIFSGIVITAATGAKAVLISGIFLPPIGALLIYAYSVWVTNDYELVTWPPKDDDDLQKGEAPSDLEVAFNMIEGLFGGEDENPETNDDAEVGEKNQLKGFQLPPLEVTGGRIDGPVKMPPLPLKSVLRKKREKMGIKLKSTAIIADLRARDGADADKFGSGDVVDINDPWAQFEEKEVEEVEQVLVKRAVKFKIIRRGIFEHPFFVKSTELMNKFAITKWAGQAVAHIYKSFQNRRKAYKKIDPEDEIEDEQQEENEVVGVKHMHFWKAFMQGFLTRQEYYAIWSWFGALLLILIYGCVLSDYVSPYWVGQVVWVSMIMVICTITPIIRYFNTYIIDDTMKQFGIFLPVLHFIFCVVFFVKALDSDIGIPGSLWILDYFFYYPAIVYILCELFLWIDNNYFIEKLDKDGDGSVTPWEYLMYFRAYPVLMALAIIMDWQMYVWITSLFGVLGILLILCSVFGYFFIRDWATNDLYVSPEMLKIGQMVVYFVMFILSCVSLFSATNPILPLCILFFILLCRAGTGVFMKILLSDVDSIIFISPFLLPSYSYNSKTGDVENEMDLVQQCIFTMLIGFVWGFLFMVFSYPVSTGVTMTCFFLLGFTAIVAASVSDIPMTLGKLSTLATTESIQDAARTALEKYSDRRSPLNLEMSDWVGEVDEVPIVIQRSQIDELKFKTVLELSVDLINEKRSLSYLKNDENQTQKIEVFEDKDEVIQTWYQKTSSAIVAAISKAFEMIPMGQMKGYSLHSEGEFGWTDACAEAIIVGRGPLGFVGADGYLHKLFLMAQDNPRLKFLKQPWLNAFDSDGNAKSKLLLLDKIDIIETYTNLVNCETALDHCYLEEARCAIHFFCMLIVAARAKLARETVLFQKFLRENRFRLASNGISPPSDIFSSSSFTSIDIPLVAVWLCTLTPEERERFNMLKQTFSEEQKEKDYAIDNEDYTMTLDALNLLQERLPREIDQSAKVKRNADAELGRKVKEFASKLESVDKAKFEMKMQIWMENADVYIDSKDQELYDKFKLACFGSDDAVTDYARWSLGQLEAAQRDCRLGEYGRNYQFVDPEFTPGDIALGSSTSSSEISGWRCAPGISEAAELFQGGAEPDDVEAGVYKDTWLLSAICMIAAGGGGESDVVTDALKKIFVGHVNEEGDVTFHTEVGAYCVRMFKQGLWNPIILDDIFPMLNHSLWTNENKGLAVAHSKECNELWVTLIEKAFAKYYGNYSDLERGFVHHALQDLTGCETECVCLAHASRGVGKRTLWEKLTRYRANGYILGAGTGSAALSDKELQDMGIVFEAAYTIYDVRYVDGHHLLKLRNPPGDHEEWKGDWSDKSTLWNKRLKSKLGMQDVDDNTFWMSFDDFCNVYRYLYVCKWYGQKWKKVVLPGIWKKANEFEETNKDDLKRVIMASDESLAGHEFDQTEEKKKKAKSAVDTSGGLPTKHNPGCVLENNPHFSLIIDRPTDLRIAVSQTDSRGMASVGDIVPFAIFICKNEHHSTPMRLTSLNRDNVVLSSGEPRKERAQYLYGQLNPGLYMIMIPPYVSGVEANFTITLLSNYRTSLMSVWPPAWMMRQKKDDKGPKKAAGMFDPNRAAAVAQDVSKNFRKTIKNLFGTSAAEDVGQGGSDSDEDES